MYHQERGQDCTGRSPTRRQNELVTATHDIPVPRDRRRIAICGEVVYNLALFGHIQAVNFNYLSWFYPNYLLQVVSSVFSQHVSTLLLVIILKKKDNV